jgi:HSP20 family protein
MFGLVRPNTLPARTGRGDVERWDPWTDLSRVRQEMDDLITRSFGLTPIGRLVDGPAAHGGLPIELQETDGQYTLRAHLPGMSREDIHLEVLENQLLLWGERPNAVPTEGAKVLYNSVGYGRFRFEYELPVEIRADAVTASYRDGVLSRSARTQSPPATAMVCWKWCSRKWRLRSRRAARWRSPARAGL